VVPPAPTTPMDDGDVPLDAEGLLSPALFEALELLVPSSTVATTDETRGVAESASASGMPAPTQGGLAIALRGLMDSNVVKSSLAGIAIGAG